MTRFASVSLLALALSASLFCAPLHAQTPPDAVVAKVDGIEIKQSDLTAAEDDIGQATARMDETQKRDYLIGFVTDLILASKAAEAQKLPENPDFKRRMDYARKKLLAETLLAQETKAKATEAEARKIYDEELKKLTPEEEVSARHILVKTEDQAKEIAAKLKAGGDFAALAKEFSEDPGSKVEGGSLGFFTKGQMVPEFSETAFAQKPGEISAPVKSQFGYHIIKTEERRMKAPPSFEQVKPQIEEYLARKAHSELITALRAKAKIERMGADGKPTAPAEAPKKQ